jgi:hypothetical protein
MSDISMFFPFPEGYVIIARINDNRGTDFVPRDLFARLTTSHGDLINDFEDYQIFALRFDVCDRAAPGPCPIGADGSLRVVFQPMTFNAGAATDAGIHAFYRIPAAEMSAAVNQLRLIARVSPPHSATDPLADRGLGNEHQAILDLLASYARVDRLIRLSAMGQDARVTDLRIVFRGLELHDGQMVDITIPDISATEQVVTMADVDPSYGVTPVADRPAGFALALTSGAFNAAAPADQRSALEAVVATENPLMHTSSTVQCVACHASTYLGAHRGNVAGIDLRTLTDHYTTTRDVRVSYGVSATEPRSLHAFSWNIAKTAISQRVANETANVLDEIEQRFPAPH